jgi:hypothetical protein
MRDPRLTFPNPSRWYDATLRAIQFWGHDRAMEAQFFISEEALRRMQPAADTGEVALLGVFDANRAAIYAAAIKVYSRGRKGSYNLVTTDF